MSKLFDLLEILTEQEGIEMLIAHCEMAVKEAERELKKDPESEELKAIRRGYNSDKEILETRNKTLQERFAILFEKAIADEKFLKEFESAKIPEDYKKAFETLKAKMSSLQGTERTQE